MRPAPSTAWNFSGSDHAVASPLSASGCLVLVTVSTSDGLAVGARAAVSSAKVVLPEAQEFGMRYIDIYIYISHDILGLHLKCTRPVEVGFLHSLTALRQ